MGRREARIGGLTFEAIPRDRAQAIVATTWDGIEGGLAIRREDIPRPAEHGSFATPAYLTARVLPFSGHIIQRSAQATLNMRNRLIGLHDGATRRLAVDLDGMAVWMDVATAAQPVVQVNGSDPCIAKFDVQFWTPNPRMFGEERTFTAGDEVFQWGNFAAKPVFTVTGALPSGYTITGPSGRRIVVAAPLVAGIPHRIDTARSGLYVAGARVIGGISVWQPWTIPPSIPGVVHTVTAGATLTVTVADTFI